ncbi:MAG: glycoside hydrolase family 32 protein [Actinobacteria bacterium]|nr:glycoside hydrolase family 32 protein [Actinomycetota bacterium]
MPDPLRPRYHFMPPSDWMNDPNGLIQWQGRYHLFYQYYPGRVAGRPRRGPNGVVAHWGHASSRDLVHWDHLTIALAPTPDGPDAEGCYSGCAVVHDGTPSILYTGVHPQRPCLATSVDADLRTWTKHPANPVIAAPPSGFDLVGFRDHSVWRQGAEWCQLIGSGIRGVGGTVPMYRSPDLVRWEFADLLLTGDVDVTDQMWECPDFFALDGRQVLVVNCHPTLWTGYFSGAYAGDRFDAAYRGRVDVGTHFYAPQTLLDAQGRRLMWGWLREARTAEAQREAGWSGVMSLPRVLRLDQHGRLWTEPAPELRALRGRGQSLRDVRLPFESAYSVEGVPGRSCEILAEFAPGSRGTAGLSVLRSPGGEEETLITYNANSDRLQIDTRRASLDPRAERLLATGPLRLARDAPLRLHVFLDGSTIEVFANGRAATARAYPTRADSTGLQVISRRAARSDVWTGGGDVRLTALDVWDMQAIWNGTERIPSE